MSEASITFIGIWSRPRPSRTRTLIRSLLDGSGFTVSFTPFSNRTSVTPRSCTCLLSATVPGFPKSVYGQGLIGSGV